MSSRGSTDITGSGVSEGRECNEGSGRILSVYSRERHYSIRSNPSVMSRCVDADSLQWLYNNGMFALVLIRHEIRWTRCGHDVRQ